MTGAIALMTIGHTLADLSTTLCQDSQQNEIRYWERMARHNREGDAMSSAMECAQEIENDLSADQLAGLIEVFQKEPGSAKAYLMIKLDNVWNSWVNRKLVSMGLASTSPPITVGASASIV